MLHQNVCGGNVCIYKYIYRQPVRVNFVLVGNIRYLNHLMNLEFDLNSCLRRENGGHRVL